MYAEKRIGFDTLRCIQWISVLVAVFAAVVVVQSYRRTYEDLLLQAQKQSRLELAHVTEQVEDYFAGIHTDLRFISLHEDIQKMNRNAHDYIMAIFRDHYQRDKLSEVYVIERDFDGTRRPFMTFEYDSQGAELEEMHSLQREQEEYRTQMEHIRQFASNPSLQLQLSKQIQLCSDEIGIVCSVPIRNKNDELMGIVAAMVPEEKVSSILTKLGANEIFLLISEHGDVFTSKKIPPKVKSWLDEKLNSLNAEQLFRDFGQGNLSLEGYYPYISEPEVFDLGKWRLVLLQSEPASIASHGFSGVGVGYSIAGLIIMMGVMVAFLCANLRKRRIAQNKAESDHKNLQILFDASPAGMLLVDENCVVKRVNKGAASFSKKIPSEAINLFPGQVLGCSNAEEYIDGNNDELSCRDCTLRQAIYGVLRHGKAVSNAEFNMICRTDGDEKELWIGVNAEHVTLDGKVHAIVALEDITERKEAEIVRQQLAEVLKEKTDELESIIQITSHDLRTPLINIIGFSNELATRCQQLQSDSAKWDLSPQIRKTITDAVFEDIPECVGLIGASAFKMDSLLNGLAQLAKLGYSPVEIDRLNMNKMFQDISRTMEFQIQQASAEIRIDSVPDCFGDKRQINQVFSNLISNGIKYLSPGRLSIITISGRTNGKNSIYCIADNGIGIEKDNIDDIFEMFYRVYPAKGHGEGLGLAIVRKIINRHHGKAWAESELGKGSRFFISLPDRKVLLQTKTGKASK